MLRCLVVAVSVLVVSTTLVAQESLWSGTMTAGKDESVFAVGFNRNPEAPIFGELSDSEFDFRGTTYRVYSLAQLANHELGEWVILLALSPRLDHQDFELMTLTVDGHALHVSDKLEVGDFTGDLPWTGVVWADPGFRWTDGQRIDAELTMAQPVPPARRGRVAGIAALG